MHKVGIDRINFYTPNRYMDLTLLAAARGYPENKFVNGIGLHKMAMPAPDEDIVTMGASAALDILADVDLQTIDTLFFATESGIDQSKAAGLFAHRLLNLPSTVRVVELKQACYSATAALRLALPYLQLNPEKKILIIAADIARYGLNTHGESSQGCGAVAMLLSANPRILAVELESGVYTEDAMDFWRPNYREEALVDGKASSKLYLNALAAAWQGYHTASGRQFADHRYFCFHVPVAKLVEKAFKYLMKISGHASDYTEEIFAQQMENGLLYNRVIGNCYTASLYLSLCSLLENSPADLTHERVGFYSYGSGAVAEFFSGIVQSGYGKTLNSQVHQQWLASRRSLTLAEYENDYNFPYPQDGSQCLLSRVTSGKFRLREINQHKRIYEKLTAC